MLSSVARASTSCWIVSAMERFGVRDCFDAQMP
ncbi:Uncharacterised protein [Mycobacteroides abscessus subsp. abscessus]|nr:Uncharacterised protein [Mycobacteroides abscessus subsp. abscessus]